MIPGRSRNHVTRSEWCVGIADVHPVHIYHTRCFDLIGRGEERHFAEPDRPRKAVGLPE